MNEQTKGECTLSLITSTTQCDNNQRFNDVVYELKEYKARLNRKHQMCEPIHQSKSTKFNEKVPMEVACGCLNVVFTNYEHQTSMDN